jgi:hypothetical protein
MHKPGRLAKHNRITKRRRFKCATLSSKCPAFIHIDGALETGNKSPILSNLNPINFNKKRLGDLASQRCLFQHVLGGDGWSYVVFPIVHGSLSSLMFAECKRRTLST